MPQLSRWMGAVGAHFAQHWTRHLLPLAVLLLVVVVLGWSMMAAWILIFGGTLLLLALEYETAAMVWFFGISALGSLFMVIYQIAGAVLVVGYSRYALRLQQGHAVSWRELLWGFRHPFRSLGVLFAVLMLVFASAGLFYLPLVFLGGWLLLVFPSLADGDRGVLGSLGRAWAMSGRVYGELLVLVLGLCGAGLFVGFFPIVGPVAGPIAAVVVGAVVYDCLSRPAAI